MTTLDESWEANLESARKYAKTLRGGAKRPEVFTPDILSGIGAMAFEQALMALIRKTDDFATPHNVGQKVAWLRQQGCIDEELGERAAAVGKRIGSCGTRSVQVDLDDLGAVVDDLINACG